MFGALPTIEPRDSHMLWYPSSRTGRAAQGSSHHGTTTSQSNRRNARSTATAPHLHSSSYGPLASLLLEERALKLRKQNIASFGYSWIRPAGFAKTMMGIREEEMECEEGANAGMEQGEAEEEFMDGVEGADGNGLGLDGQGGGNGEAEGEGVDTGMERDLDGDIPDGEGEGFGLVEEGEEAYEDEEEEFLDEEEEGMMERDLDDDVPEASNGDGSDDEDEEDEGDGEDAEDAEEHVEENAGAVTGELRTPVRRTARMRTPVSSHLMMDRNLDSSILHAPQETPFQQQQWEHTDSDEDVYDDYDDEDEEEGIQHESEVMDMDASRMSLASLHEGNIPRLTPSGPRRETEAERIFLERWGGHDESPGSRVGGASPENMLSISRRRSRRHAAEDFEQDEL